MVKKGLLLGRGRELWNGLDKECDHKFKPLFYATVYMMARECDVDACGCFRHIIQNFHRLLKVSVLC